MTEHDTTARPPRMVLAIFLLNVQSSYTDDAEAAALGAAADTVQFLATPDGAWRIRTYAVDQDVHVWPLGTLDLDVVALAHESTEKHYGDVLAQAHVIESDTGLDGLRGGLAAHGLGDSLAVSADGYCFWVPEGSDYRTRSMPRLLP